MGGWTRERKRRKKRDEDRCGNNADNLEARANLRGRNAYGALHVRPSGGGLFEDVVRGTIFFPQ